MISTGEGEVFAMAGTGKCVKGESFGVDGGAANVGEAGVGVTDVGA
jgi:hypothetical protein